MEGVEKETGCRGREENLKEVIGWSISQQRAPLFHSTTPPQHYFSLFCRSAGPNRASILGEKCSQLNLCHSFQSFNTGYTDTGLWCPFAFCFFFFFFTLKKIIILIVIIIIIQFFLNNTINSNNNNTHNQIIFNIYFTFARGMYFVAEEGQLKEMTEAVQNEWFLFFALFYFYFLYYSFIRYSYHHYS